MYGQDELIGHNQAINNINPLVLFIFFLLPNSSYMQDTVKTTLVIWQR